MKITGGVLKYEQDAQFSHSSLESLLEAYGTHHIDFPTQFTLLVAPITFHPKPIA